jgi:hypothetical protein
MPIRKDLSSRTHELSLGATPERSNLEVGALIATGVCVAAPSAVVLGSLQTTFVVGGAAATACAVGAHRVSNGKELWPFGKEEPKAGETPVKTEVNGKEVEAS